MYKKIHIKKFEEVSKIVDELKGVSGIYIFHTLKHVWYVGRTKCLRHRFKNGYLKGKSSKQHFPKELIQRIEKGLPVSVAIALVPEEILESKEKEVIRKACPWFNDEFNPRGSLRGIQSFIGEIVEETQQEWTYEEMTKHLFYYYKGQIGSKKIEEALANKNGNLSKYCSVSGRRRILKPKKKKTQAA